MREKSRKKKNFKKVSTPIQKKKKSSWVMLVLLGLVSGGLIVDAVFQPLSQKSKTLASETKVSRTELTLREACMEIHGGHSVHALSPFFLNYKSKFYDYSIPGVMVDHEIVFTDGTGRCRVYTDGRIVLGKNFTGNSMPILIGHY